MNSEIARYSIPLTISTSKDYLILFILWPFLAFLTAIMNYSQKEAKKVVYIFLVYYGLTFVIGNTGMDSERYAIGLKLTSELPFSDFFKVIGGLYTETSVDIIEPLVNFIVSRFTSFHGVLFAVWAGIFAIFYLKSINLLHERFLKNPSWNLIVIMTFFIMLMPITTVSGVRMPIAIWAFFYGAYHVVLYRDFRYFTLTLAASLMHWSFVTANALLVMYYFLGNRNIIYLPVCILSFILPTLLAPLFQTLALKIGGPIQARYEGYTHEGYISAIQESKESASWFLSLSENLIFYYLLAVIIFIQIWSVTRKKEYFEKNLYSFLLLFLSFVNFGKIIPTFGGRFQGVFYLFATFYVFLNFLKMPMKQVNLLTWIGIFPMFLYSAVTFRIGSETINAWILTPGLGLPLLAPGLSLADLLFN